MSKERIITPVEAFLSRADGGSKVEFAALVESHGLTADQLVANNQMLPGAAEAIAAARLRRQIADQFAAIRRAKDAGLMSKETAELAIGELNKQASLVGVVVGPPMAGAPRLAGEGPAGPPQSQ